MSLSKHSSEFMDIPPVIYNNVFHLSLLHMEKSEYPTHLHTPYNKRMFAMHEFRRKAIACNSPININYAFSGEDVPQGSILPAKLITDFVAAARRLAMKSTLAKVVDITLPCTSIIAAIYLFVKACCRRAYLEMACAAINVANSIYDLAKTVTDGFNIDITAVLGDVVTILSTHFPDLSNNEEAAPIELVPLLHTPRDEPLRPVKGSKLGRDPLPRTFPDSEQAAVYDSESSHQPDSSDSELPEETSSFPTELPSSLRPPERPEFPSTRPKSPPFSNWEKAMIRDDMYNHPSNIGPPTSDSSDSNSTASRKKKQHRRRIPVDQPQAKTSPLVSVLVKCGSVVASICALLCGKKVSSFSNTVQNFIRTTAGIEEMVGDIFQGVLGFDLDGVVALREAIAALEKSGQDILNIPTGYFHGERLAQALKWKNDAEDLLRRVKSSQVNSHNLTGLVAAVGKRIADMRQLTDKQQLRPVPFSFYLYGDAGLGKSDYIDWFFSALNASYKIDRPNTVYNLNAGKHFLPLSGECWAKYDEIGATTTAGDNTIDAACLNAIISGTSAAIPGASLETKTQTAEFSGIVFGSNLAPGNIDLGFQPEGRTAFESRLRVFQVIDPQYKKTFGRTSQPHRKPDFSHLRFRYSKTSPPLPFAFQGDLTGHQLVEIAIADIEQNQKRFLERSTTPAPAFAIPGPLWTPELPSDKPQSNAVKKIVWVSGAPGIGKSSILVPGIEASALACGLPIRRSMKACDEPCLYILDDEVDPASGGGQAVFSQFYDRMREDQTAVIISNYGRISGLGITKDSWLGMYQRARPFADIHPPFLRRTAHGTKYSFEIMGSRLYNSEGKHTIEEFNKKLVAYMSACPDVPIHFTKYDGNVRDFDFDISLAADAGISALCSALTRNMGPVALKLGSKTSKLQGVLDLVRSCSHENIATATQRVMQYLRHNDIDLTVRVTTEDTEFVYDGSACYMGDATRVVKEMNPNNVVLKLGDVEETIPATWVRQLITSEVTSFPANLCTYLAIAKKTNTQEWRELLSYYGTGYQVALQNFWKTIKSCSLRLYEALKPAFFPILAIIGLILIIRYFYPSVKVLGPLICSCNTPVKSPQAYELLATEGKYFEYVPCPDLAQGKKGRSRSSAFHHFSKWKFGDTMMTSSADDIEDMGQQTERVYFALKNIVQNGRAKNRFKVANIEYSADFDEDSMTWHVNQLDEIHSDDIYSSFARKISNNVQVITDGVNDMHVTFITPERAIAPAHISTFNVEKLTIQGRPMKIIHINKAREFCVLKLDSKDMIPHVANISRNVLPIEKIRCINTAVAFKNNEYGGRDFLQTNYKFIEKTMGFNHPDVCNWDIEAGIISFADVGTDFYGDGDCGMPIIGIYNNKPYLVGVHAVKRARSRQWNSIVISTNALSEVRDKPQQQTLTTDPAGNSVSFPSKFKSAILPPNHKTLTSYVPKGAVTVNSLVKNLKKMDSKNDRIEYGHFPQTTKSFEVKRPALDEVMIYLEHQDKIPQDQRGNHHVFLIRSQTLENNYFDRKQQVELGNIAKALGLYYKMKWCIPNLTPLDIETAVFGSPHITGTDFSTAAGVAMIHMFSARTKDQLLSGSQVRPEVMEAINEQMDAAKRGHRITYPADANFKAELLPEEKTWKKRVFYNVPFPTIINMKRFIALIQMYFTQKGMESPFIFAAYPLRDWDNLSQELQRMGRHIICLDASSYDHSVPGAAILAVGEFSASFFPHNKTEVRTLFAETAFSPLIFKETMIDRQGGVPSGAFGTNYTDGVSFHILLVCVFMRLTKLTVDGFFRNVSIKICGDDCILAVTDDVIDAFNGKTIQRTMKQMFGMKITPASKTGEMVKAGNINDASFCSREFVPLPNHPSTRIPKIKTSAIYGCLTYSRSTDPFDLYEQYLGARQEVFPYGKELYETFENELSEFAIRNDIRNHIPMSYADCEEMMFLEVGKKHRQILKNSTQLENLSSGEIFRLDNLYCIDIQNEERSIMSKAKISALCKKLTCKISVSSTFDEFREIAEDELRILSEIPIDLFDLSQRASFRDPDNKHVGMWSGNATAGYYGLLTRRGLDLPVTRVLFTEWRESRYYTTRTNATSIRFNEYRRGLISNYQVETSSRSAWSDFKLFFANYASCYWPKEEGVDICRKCAPEETGEISAVDSILMEATDEPQSNMAEQGTSSGQVVTGSGGGEQIDPLAAPVMVNTPAVTLDSQAVTGGDSTAAPMILETVGGLSVDGLASLAYANNVAALCGQPIFTKAYQLTSNTAAGTIIDEIPFNPWAPEVVSKPIADYGNLHTIFNGSFEFTLNSYGAATIIGSLIAAYIPAELQNNFIVNLPNLTALPHVIIDVKDGGSSRIAFTGGNLKDCAVSRREIENGAFYGKMIIAAFTNITNAYNQNVPIPIVRSTRLGEGAYYSHPSFFNRDSGGGGYVNPGPTPAFARNLIVDGENYWNDLGVLRDAHYVRPLLGGAVLVGAAPTGLRLFKTDGTNAVRPAFHWGASTEKTLRETIQTMFASYADNGWDTVRTSDSIRIDFERCPMAMFDTPDNGYMRYTGVQASTQGISMVVEHRTYDEFESMVDKVVTTMPSFNAPVDIKIYPHPKIDNRVGVFETETGETLTKSTATAIDEKPYTFTVDLGANANPTSKASLAYEIDIDITGTPICGTAYTGNALETAPPGFQRLEFADDPEFIPAVQPTVGSGATIPRQKETNLTMRNVRTYLDTEDLESYTYDLVTLVGQKIGSVLFNRKGAFVYSETLRSQYLVFPRGDGIVYKNFQPYSTMWPVISELDPAAFTSRVASTIFGSKVMRQPMRIEKNRSIPVTSLADHEIFTLMKEKLSLEVDKPQAAAAAGAVSSIGGGLLSGLGQGLAMIGQRKHDKDMLKSQFKGMKDLQGNQIMSDQRINKSQLAQRKFEATMNQQIAYAKMGYDINSQTRGALNKSGMNMRPRIPGRGVEVEISHNTPTHRTPNNMGSSVPQARIVNDTGSSTA